MRLTWTPLVTGGFGNPNNKNIRALVEFQDRLYAITSNGRDGGEVHRSCHADPSHWEKIVDRSFFAFGNTRRRARPFRSREVHQGSLYLGTGMVAQIWRSDNGTDWHRVADEGFGKGWRNFSVRALQVYRDDLYAGTGAEFLGCAQVYRSRQGDVWSPVSTGGIGHSRRNSIVYALGVFQDQLYAGTFNVLQGAAVYRSSDGESWEQVGDHGFGRRRNLYIYDFRLYQPTGPSRTWLIATTGGNIRGGEVWAFDGKRWSAFAQPGFGKWRNSEMWASGQFESDFYVGTWKYPVKSSSDNGAELWRFDHQAGRWDPETRDGFGNPDNDGFRVILPWRRALYASVHNRRTGAELWRGTAP